MTDFEKLVSVLSDSRVDFIIIVGGLAATAHGSARLTQDVDVVYSRARDNVERLVRALAPFHPYLRGAPPGLPFEWSVATIERGLNFTLATSVGDIDLLGEITGGGGYERLADHTIAGECRAKAQPTERGMLDARAASRLGRARLRDRSANC